MEPASYTTNISSTEKKQKTVTKRNGHKRRRPISPVIAIPHQSTLPHLGEQQFVERQILHEPGIANHYKFHFGLLATLFLLMGATLIFAQGTQSGQTTPPIPITSSFEDPPLDLRKLLVAFLLICVNSFFAIAEYALITVRRTRIRQLAEEGNRNANAIETLLEQPTRLMATIQTVVTLIATLSAALAATSAVRPLAHWITIHLPGIPSPYIATLALLAVTIPVGVIALVIGEVAPKSLVVRNPEPFALLAVQPIRALQTILTPFVRFITFLSALIVRPFGGTVSFAVPNVNREELEIFVEQGVEQGIVDEGKKEMITSILDFGDTVVRKVMTPRIDLTTFPATGTMPELIHLVADSGHSRIPIFDGDLDNIIGIVHAKDLLALPGDASRDGIFVTSVMRPPYFIPETKKIDALLTEFRRSKQQLAIVRDEYGVTSGLVTIEDLLEEIVGDIQDEYDEEEPQVQVLDATTTILDGKMSLEDVNERMALELPEEEADTIGGFVFGLLGHAALQGERTHWEGVEFVVEATDGRRITKVRLVRGGDGEESAPSSGDATGNNGSDSDRTEMLLSP